MIFLSFCFQSHRPIQLDDGFSLVEINGFVNTEKIYGKSNKLVDYATIILYYSCIVNFNYSKEYQMNYNYDNVGKWISVLYRQFQIYINNELKTFDLNSSQYVFLLSLYKQDGVSQEELANRLFIDKGAAARAIKQLEENGYLTRKINESDKRAYEVYLTEKALNIKTEIKVILDEWNEIISGDQDEEEMKILINTLKNMSSKALKHHKTMIPESND